MGKRPRLLFVHGSVVNAELTWAAQKPLADRFELVLPNRRGFPPGPDVDRVDFEDEAVWFEQFLEPGTHVVGHSYGGVIALLLAAAHPELGSLTVIEPPATSVARGVPAVDDFVAGAEWLWSEGPRDPAEFLATFFTAVGTPVPPGEFNAALLQGARTLMVERLPSEAEIPLDALAADALPEARRHRRAPCGVRGDRRRARRRASRRNEPSSRAPATRCSASARRSTTLLADFVTRSS